MFDLSSDTSSHLNFYFNFSQLIPSDEHIIEAEFHIYKLKSHTKLIERRDDPKHNLLENGLISSIDANNAYNCQQKYKVKVYQILSKDNSNKRLLDVRRMSTHSIGWDVFYVKQAVLDWINDPNTNYERKYTIK
ncbi:unnamed protein product [Medioppia subpectinata]|uniref:TGF-beta propeptide domain-containing protein n=1 Tax=Medioppia subpectinata TaxID=1979941 RepID=A0A7R9L3D8_9ACAR|nr:unnamed protein product [Medioppia subpectinata]CAG2113641.1 unnamed protein product [Medioppia subpectinata]